jgi:RNA polymerase sigma-70 factor (ECF subfamily)
MSSESLDGESMDKDICTWIFNHLSEYVDAELQTDVCDQLESHMGECPSCRALVHTMRGTVGLVHDLSTRTIPAECLNRIRERLLKGRNPA